MISSLAHIFFTVVFIYLCLNVAYLFILAIAGVLGKRRSLTPADQKSRVAVLITSYREDSVIFNTLQRASSHDYPRAFFKVFLAADHLQETTLTQLRKLDATIVTLNNSRSSKARSMYALFNTIQENEFDIALILDGDNIMMPGFIEKVNAAFQHGYQAVQGHRTAKNKNSPIAILDALSEEVNNNLFRRGQRVMGFSSSLIGSGMAFRFCKIKEVYNKPGILDNPACDREVDFEMMKAGIVVEYLDDAILLDEKVSQGQVYENQRRRWIESQFIHLKLFFSKKEKVIVKTRDYWNKLFINLIPPRLIFLLLLLLMAVISLSEYFFHVQYTGISFVAWCSLPLIYFLSLLVSVPFNFYNMQTLRALGTLPLLLFRLLKAATGLHISRKEFVHTPKSFTGEKPSR